MSCIFGAWSTWAARTARLSPDHIEIASVAALGAITHGTLTIEGVNPDHLRLISRVFARLGVNLYLNGDTLFLPAHDKLVASQRDEELDVPIDTAPWPGFPSDLIAMATVVATQAHGTTLIHEKLFDNRLLFVDKLTSDGRADRACAIRTGRWWSDRRRCAANTWIRPTCEPGWRCSARRCAPSAA